MKVKRYKKAQKILHFYVNNYGFHEPYQVLIDGTFAKSARDHKVQIAEQLTQYLHTKLKLLTTPCVITEMEKLGPALKSAFFILKQFGVHKCGHAKNPVTGSECLLSMVGSNNKSRYMVATQDKDLQAKLVDLSGVPLLYLHGQVPTMKPPSKTSQSFAEKLIQETAGMTEEQEKIIKEMKVKCGLEKDTVDIKKKKKKGGPNPLSCKKKKKENVHINNASENKAKIGKVHKKKRIKIASHIKEALKASV
ncbi:rRNA-processing protein UTP23 homolog [Copidosoma floridanum]|uniref:rRNA-processing protein UTP23 homolog n=1 Tax=Copidosoma floridanum TaxID=29053 RepID=UPI0006C9B881|nr:rRNA-processing protein UTP23 homolog [Copidosoma floridanum]